MGPMECKCDGRIRTKDQAVSHGETARRNSTQNTTATVLCRDLRCRCLRLREAESLTKQWAEASESVDAHEASGESCSIMPKTAVYAYVAVRICPVLSKPAARLCALAGRLEARLALPKTTLANLCAAFCPSCSS